MLRAHEQRIHSGGKAREHGLGRAYYAHMYHDYKLAQELSQAIHPVPRVNSFSAFQLP